MEKFLKPVRLDVNPNIPTASKEWLHWKRSLDSFLTAVTTSNTTANKLDVLVNLISPTIYEYISAAENYDSAIKILETLYIKPKNKVFARYTLTTRKQKPGESIDEFLQSLRQLALDCDFKSVTAEVYCEQSILDAFISGINSNIIRQRLLESKEDLKLENAYNTARSLDLAQKNSEQYQSPVFSAATQDSNFHSINPSTASTSSYQQNSQSTWSCYNCGGVNRHFRQRCPAKFSICEKCNRKGHYSKVCRSKETKFSANINTTTTEEAFQNHNVAPTCDINYNTPYLAATSAGAPDCLSHAIKNVVLNGHEKSALIDTGSSENFISKSVIECINIPYQKGTGEVSMAASSITSKVEGHCVLDINLQNRKYSNVAFTILSDLCADIILGQAFMKQHSSVTLTFGGELPPLSICSLASSNVSPPSLFANVSSDCYPVKTSSRRFSKENEKFIEAEIQKLLKDCIIEPSNSPWRAQVVVVTNDRHKKRLCVDYSQTINRFTYLDAYPLPRIDVQVNKIANYKVYSTLDLKSAYHQIPLIIEDKIYTAFEANGKLYQFTRIPFGLTNAVAAFQRKIDDFISEYDLKDTFAYVDNITTAGNTQEEHDFNLSRLIQAAKEKNFTFNEGKSIISVTEINILGYAISHKSIKPDPERLKPLRELPLPTTTKEKQRAIGFFSYYSQFIPNYSEKVRPLIQAANFPLDHNAVGAFELLKKDIENAVVQSIDEDIPFTVETDASDFALAATLNQNGRPVAFFSKTLSKHEINHPPVEKEAQAIVDAVRKWKHYLAGRHFTLITDQEAVSYMYDLGKKGKIKNDKMMRWRMELGFYSYDIQYRPGKFNQAADCLSRTTYCSALLYIDKSPQSQKSSSCVTTGSSSNKWSLQELHDQLCHPGITRTNHFVKCRNLPYSLDEIKNLAASCPICAEIKPRFYKPPPAHLIKSTQPFERINIDFKGPVPSNNRNIYIFTVIDEFSRFPFAFPCEDVTTATVIKCLSQLFALFGMPSYVHSDNGSSLVSNELKTFLHSRGIATSNTSPYNPRGNGQVERYNGIIWRTISLALKSRKLHIKEWQNVLLDALHSIRSLLCTSTNVTPHERFLRHQRKSTNGRSIPTWLMEPGQVFVRKHVRNSKYDPIVEEAELMEVNPQYAFVRMKDGRQTTVSIKDVAPRGDVSLVDDSVRVTDSTNGVDSTDFTINSTSNNETEIPTGISEPPTSTIVHDDQSDINNIMMNESNNVRRSQRSSKPPQRYGFDE